MSRQPMNGPAGESSSDGEDYYNDFSVFKQKHKAVDKEPPPELTFCASPVPKALPVDDEDAIPCQSDSSLDDYEVDAIERAMRDGKRQKGTKAEADELDEEMADLVNSQTSSDSSRQAPPQPAKGVRHRLNDAHSASVPESPRPRDDSVVLLDDTAAADSPSIVYVSSVGLDGSAGPQGISCTVNLRDTRSGKSEIVRWRMKATFREQIAALAPRMDIEAEKVILMRRGERLYPEKTPGDYGFSKDDLTEVDLVEDFDARGMFIAVKWLLRGEKPIPAKIPKKQRFAVIKETLCKERGLDPAKTRLMFDAEVVDDQETPTSLDLEDDDCIDVHCSG